jgi:hypothetical protein
MDVIVAGALRRRWQCATDLVAAEGSETENREQGGIHAPLLFRAEAAGQVAQSPNVHCTHLFDENPCPCPFDLDLGSE